MCVCFCITTWRLIMMIDNVEDVIIFHFLRLLCYTLINECSDCNLDSFYLHDLE